jgi:hypothetical protein
MIAKASKVFHVAGGADVGVWVARGRSCEQCINIRCSGLLGRFVSWVYVKGDGPTEAFSNHGSLALILCVELVILPGCGEADRALKRGK